jgi:hypothetical protein
MELGETKAITAITVTTETEVAGSMAGEAMVVETAAVGEMVVAVAAIRGPCVWPKLMRS